MALRYVHDSSSAAFTQGTWNEKVPLLGADRTEERSNPVIDSARFVYRHIDLVKINEDGVRAAARHIHTRLTNEGYSPHTWRGHPLHLTPPQHYLPDDPRTKACLDWLFLVSSLNFSFWSDKEGTAKEAERFGVEWRGGWNCKQKKIWTGYWSLVAAINKALEAGIPVTNPLFYASEISCPDKLLEDIFRPAAQCSETAPLLAERISVMRKVGAILVSKFGGSYAGLMSHYLLKYSKQGTALELVQMIVEEFPPFRDEVWLEGRKVCFWKRAQILVAETWAAFYPPPASRDPHPFFPRGIGQLTMFADYRVPQILHHLRIISYPPALLYLLGSRVLLPAGCRPELAIRAVSILAVEAVRDEISRLQQAGDLVRGGVPEVTDRGRDEFSSVMIDFFLWDLAKKVERGEERIDDIETSEMVPAHRTRSIWY